MPGSKAAAWKTRSETHQAEGKAGKCLGWDMRADATQEVLQSGQEQIVHSRLHCGVPKAALGNQARCRLSCFQT